MKSRGGDRVYRHTLVAYSRCTAHSLADMLGLCNDVVSSVCQNLFLHSGENTDRILSPMHEDIPMKTDEAAYTLQDYAMDHFRSAVCSLKPGGLQTFATEARKGCQYAPLIQLGFAGNLSALVLITLREEN